MKGAELGAKRSLSCGSINQAVVPATGLPSASVQSKAAPPQTWTSIPRCRLYQACSAGASLALKKMPPMPVTRFIVFINLLSPLVMIKAYYLNVMTDPVVKNCTDSRTQVLQCQDES